MTKKTHAYDQIVFLLQGGGALGSYQVGVCQALFEHGIQPDWVVGTSIGAINAAIIAGNPPEHRTKRLNEFWDKISIPLPLFPILPTDKKLREYMNLYSAQQVSLLGVPGFFKPRLINPWLTGETTPDKISFYDTSELRETLLSLIDFDLINKKKTRLTLGAVSATTGKAVRFDNFNHVITPEHIMASGALPPGFPAVKIDDEYYWDGGINSNTPFGVVLQERVPQKLLCFIVNLYSYRDHVPDSMMGVMKATKEIEYSSRHNELLKYFCEVHFLQNVIQSLAKKMSDDDGLKTAIERIKDIGHPTALNIVRFHYLDCPTDLWSKDFNFSKLVINEHWKFGYHDVKKALQDPSWLEVDVGEKGVELHEF